MINDLEGNFSEKFEIHNVCGNTFYLVSFPTKVRT
jgi:hypothetical protein